MKERNNLYLLTCSKVLTKLHRRQARRPLNCSGMSANCKVSMVVVIKNIFVCDYSINKKEIIFV